MTGCSGDMDGPVAGWVDAGSNGVDGAGDVLAACVVAGNVRGGGGGGGTIVSEVAGVATSARVTGNVAADWVLGRVVGSVFELNTGKGGGSEIASGAVVAPCVPAIEPARSNAGDHAIVPQRIAVIVRASRSHLNVCSTLRSPVS
jgi:hypothetical protein